jgi:hypothetical protein
MPGGDLLATAATMARNLWSGLPYINGDGFVIPVFKHTRKNSQGRDIGTVLVSAPTRNSEKNLFCGTYDQKNVKK